MINKIEKALLKKGCCIVEVDDSPQGQKVRDVLLNKKYIGTVESYEVVKNESNYVFYLMLDDGNHIHITA